MTQLGRFPVRDLVVIVATLLTFGGAFIQGLSEGEKINWTWPGIAAAVLVAVPIAVRAFIFYSQMVSERKAGRSQDPPDTPIALGLVAALMLIVVMSGCAFNGRVNTHFEENITDPDGTVDNYTYDAKSSAGIGGKLDTTIHKLDYAWGGAENRIAIGQDLQNLDNTRQVEIINNAVNRVADLLLAVIQLYANSAGRVDPGPVPDIVSPGSLQLQLRGAR